MIFTTLPGYVPVEVIIMFVALMLSTNSLQEILTGPNHFDCIITPRSVQHDEIIRQNFLEASFTFEAFEYDASPEDGAFLSQMRGELKDGLHV